MPNQTPSLVSLRSATLSAEIDPNGAELFALRDRDGRDLLWNGEPAVWTGRAPILFPIVGMLVDGKYRLDSRSYSLPRHGFARNRGFSVLSSTAGKAAFRLSADDATLQVYPFRFELDIQFELSGPTLTMTATIRNPGHDEMWASFGWHPGFRWPLPYGQPRSSHFIQFDQEEPDEMRRIDASGLLIPEGLPTPILHRHLVLKDELFKDDAIIFDRIRSRSVTYGANQGPGLKVDFPDMPYLGVWTKPGGQFICIEPWHGITDPQGFAGDFKQKPGVFAIAPRASKSTSVAITLLE
jgi:galactose mutarotase-like enzyme